jgi:YVTN family beta-propeller protein
VAVCAAVAGSATSAGVMALASSARPELAAVPATSPTASPLSTPAPTLASPPLAPAFNVYAATMTGLLSPAVAGIPERVYVPDSNTNTVTVIDPKTMTVIARLVVGRFPEHVTPAYDLSRLYVDNEGSWNLEAIDPRTEKVTTTMAVPDPYNLYFTPDGTKAIVVQENLRRLEFRDPHTWRVIKDVPVAVRGVDHLDFTADGHFFLITEEFTGTCLIVDAVNMTIVGNLSVGGYPIDVRLSPDGTVFFVANQSRNGVSVVDATTMKDIGFIPTGRGAHGLYISRDTQSLYVTNRLAGSISVINIATRTVTATWHVGGSPDMIQLNPDGTQLWTSSRFDGYVIVVDTATGRVIKRIYCGSGAHGLSYFPAPGQYSVGHNGVYR